MLPCKYLLDCVSSSLKSRSNASAVKGAWMGFLRAFIRHRAKDLAGCTAVQLINIFAELAVAQDSRQDKDKQRTFLLLRATGTFQTSFVDNVHIPGR